MSQTEDKSRRQLLAERISTASQRSLTIQVIMVLSAFAGLCSTMFPILKSFMVSDGFAYLFTAIFTLLVLGLLLAFFFINSWKVYLVRATVALLLAFSLVLCGLLYWQYFYVDEWLRWNDKVTAKVKDCEALYQQKRSKKTNSPGYNGDNAVLSNEYDEKVTCVGEAIKESYPHEGQQDVKKIVALDNDVRAGTYLIENPVVSEVLKSRLGIGERFLGTGLAVPSSGQTYGDARLVEYMVPNLPEEDNKVLVWQIQPLPNLSQSVECLIVGCIDGKNHVNPTLPGNVRSASEEKYKNIINYVSKPENRAADNKVILIRLSQFDRKDKNGGDVYSKRLGRTESSRVFMIRLKDVWNVSLKDAITLSGHEGNGDTLFVWIYTPTADDAIALATWNNILPNVEKLLKRP
jgi:hypothetical protein